MSLTLCSLQRGRIFEIQEKYIDAKNCFDNAIAINPAHVPSIQHLVRFISLHFELVSLSGDYVVSLPKLLHVKAYLANAVSFGLLSERKVVGSNPGRINTAGSESN